jgi:Zn-dependent M16 (insulinase) family peptidase
VQELLIENPHRTTVLVKPDPEQGEREAAEERERLADVRAGFDRAEIDRLVMRTVELKRWQDTPDTTEAIATIPSLSLSDLPKRNKTIPCHLAHVDGVEVLSHELSTNGIMYLDLAFDLHPLSVDQLPILDVFARSLLETGAGDFDFVGLTQRIGRTTGGISASSYVSAVSDERGCVARLIIRAKAVPEKADELVSILQDVLLASRIDDRGRIKQIVLEEKASAEAMLTPMGHLLAARRVNAGLHEAGFVQEQICGLTRLFGLRTLADRINSDWPSVAADLEAMRRQLITKAGLVTNVTADETTLSQFNSRLETLITALPSGLPDTAASWAWTPVNGAEGFAIPAKVNYVAKGGDLRELGLKSTGAALVAQNLLSTTWLWDKVRLQGGAYGGFCRFDRLSGSFSYISYRDPNLLETLEVYDSTAQHLRQAELGEQELKRAIIGTIGSIDTYLLPDLKGLTSLQRHLARDSDDARQVMRDEVLATTAGDLRAIADVLDALAECGRVAILGSNSALASANKVRGGNWLSVTPVM